MPVAATARTEAGAQAFAAFFVRTIDWGYATTSSAYMRHYFAKSCESCFSYAGALDSTRAKSRHYMGDRFLIKSVKTSLDPALFGSSYVLDVTFDVSAEQAIDSAGRALSGAPASPGTEVAVYAKWSGSWRVVSFDLVK